MKNFENLYITGAGAIGFSDGVNITDRDNVAFVDAQELQLRPLGSNISVLVIRGLAGGGIRDHCK
ncbi:hypothetical protein [Flavihumibacter profundi]|nr:hypothetical protein [Flavihumibacter profundi]